MRWRYSGHQSPCVTHPNFFLRVAEKKTSHNSNVRRNFCPTSQNFIQLISQMIISFPMQSSKELSINVINLYKINFINFLLSSRNYGSLRNQIFKIFSVSFNDKEKTTKEMLCTSYNKTLKGSLRSTQILNLI